MFYVQRARRPANCEIRGHVPTLETNLHRSGPPEKQLPQRSSMQTIFPGLLQSDEHTFMQELVRL